MSNYKYIYGRECAPNEKVMQLCDFEDVLRKLTEARVALASVEWCGNEDETWCPACQNHKHNGHSDDCPVGKVLKI